MEVKTEKKRMGVPFRRHSPLAGGLSGFPGIEDIQPAGDHSARNNGCNP
ncbi:MAG: hypothetical protein ACLFSA_03420 [Spirochaetaceae bacterium]